jgi:hypothetical protein
MPWAQLLKKNAKKANMFKTWKSSREQRGKASGVAPMQLGRGIQKNKTRIKRL